MLQETFTDLYQALPEEKQRRVVAYMNMIKGSVQPNERLLVETENMVSEALNIPVEDFYKKTRKEYIRVRRQILWYVMHKRLCIPCGAAGKRYGYDHTTVLHACNVVDTLYGKWDYLTNLVDSLPENKAA